MASITFAEHTITSFGETLVFKCRYPDGKTYVHCVRPDSFVHFKLGVECCQGYGLMLIFDCQQQSGNFQLSLTGDHEPDWKDEWENGHISHKFMDKVKKEFSSILENYKCVDLEDSSDSDDDDDSVNTEWFINGGGNFASTIDNEIFYLDLQKVTNVEHHHKGGRIRFIDGSTHIVNEKLYAQICEAVSL